MLAASVHYPIRGAVTFKSTVGTNVASDALANLASGGVKGGALLIVGEVVALADKGNLNKSQASRAAQILVDKGWVQKTGHPSDGRGVELSLTPAGQKLWKKTMALIDARNQLDALVYDALAGRGLVLDGR